ncbi:hypothetical protein WJX81_005669 [Elliptochloris bilobata]|uniref:Uncharacterized protein n=1 Tax=Elliptochloris bilobata TaxID=381761 RepID=A0AAW1SCD6_9CHLO
MSAGATQPAVRRLAGHRGPILCCKLREDGHTALSGDEKGAVCLFDLRVERATHSLTVLTLDLRQAGGGGAPAVRRYEANSDEVNSVAVHTRGTYVAAGDDAGVVQVLDLRTHEPYKVLRGGHANICAAVAFRPHRPWELLSGGLDGALVRWDFSTGRPRRSWQMVDDAGPDGTQVFNPPLVHALAAGPAGAPRAIGRLVAVARGDGAIGVYDADAPAEGAVPRGQDANRRSRATAGSGHGEAAADRHALDGSAAAQPEQDAGGAAASGRLALLGAELGGHRRAASCVCFLADGTGRRLK